MSDWASKLINGRYAIVDSLGSGGMGEVFLAKDIVLGRQVAIKRCYKKYPKSYACFRDEARSQAKLLHPNIVSIFDFGYDLNGQPFICMEYFEGKSVQHLIKRAGKIELARTIEIIRTAAQALAVAHDQGVLHRDVKPGNLLIGRDNTVKLSDFGLAKTLNQPPNQINNNLVGTFGFVAPEQITMPDSVDCRADVYSLGMSMIAMLTGHPQEVHKSLLPPSIERLIHHATQREPDARLRNMIEFLDRLPPATFDRVGTIETIAFCSINNLTPITKSDHPDLKFDLADVRFSRDEQPRTIEGYAFDPSRQCAIYIIRMHENNQLADKRACKANTEYSKVIHYDSPVAEKLVEKHAI